MFLDLFLYCLTVDISVLVFSSAEQSSPANSYSDVVLKKQQQLENRLENSKASRGPTSGMKKLAKQANGKAKGSRE